MKSKSLKIVLFTAIVAYLAMSFISATFNPALMDYTLKKVGVFVWIVVCGIYFMICAVVYDE